MKYSVISSSNLGPNAVHRVVNRKQRVLFKRAIFIFELNKIGLIKTYINELLRCELSWQCRRLYLSWTGLRSISKGPFRLPLKLAQRCPMDFSWAEAVPEVRAPDLRRKRGPQAVSQLAEWSARFTTCLGFPHTVPCRVKETRLVTWLSS